jgi:hypothetical protein
MRHGPWADLTVFQAKSRLTAWRRRSRYRRRHPVHPRRAIATRLVIGFPQQLHVDQERQRRAPHRWLLTRLRCNPLQCR